MGALTVFAIVGTTLTYYTSRNGASAEISKGDEMSFSFSEAGLHNALGVLMNSSNDPIDPNLLPPTTTEYAGGSVTWSGTFDSNDAKWTLTSIGKVKNPSAGSADLKRTLTAKVPIYPVNTQPMAFDAWNYVYSYGTGDPSGCDMTISSSARVDTRLMAAGNLCVTSSAGITGGDVLVGGQINLTGNNSFIGTSSVPVNRVDAVNGCKAGSGSLHDPCQGPPGNADRVWANTITESPELEPAPPVDLDAWYKKASPGPYHPCQTSSGTPPVFDNDQGSTPDVTKRNRSVVTSFNLTPTSSYTCQTTLGGSTFGELSWNNTTKVLTVKGTIFIDGDAKLTQSGSYTGLATIYLSGSFRFEGGPRFCAAVSASPPACNFTAAAWDPDTRLLTIVANGANGQSGVPAGVSMVMSGTDGNWQGALYGGPNKISIENSFEFGGPIIADEVMVTGSVKSQPFAMFGDTTPSGMPGNKTVTAQPDKPQLFSG
jgi:hypothetical protein